MKNINLQERYFQDILDSLVLTDGTDYSDLLTMSYTLLDLCVSLQSYAPKGREQGKTKEASKSSHWFILTGYISTRPSHK